MPGRKDAGGRAMSPAFLYRSVSASDTNTPTGIEALDAITYDGTVQYADDNKLIVQAVMPSTVSTYDIEVYGSMLSEETEDNKVQDEGEDRWALIATSTGNTASAFVILPECPVGEIKVLVTNKSGSGSIRLYVSHSA